MPVARNRANPQKIDQDHRLHPKALEEGSFTRWLSSNFVNREARTLLVISYQINFARRETSLGTNFRTLRFRGFLPSKCHDFVRL